MVESTGKGGNSKGVLLANKLFQMNMDERTSALAAFQPKKLIYEVALAPTKVELMHDEETDQDIIKKQIIKNKLTDDQTWKYAKAESDLHAQLSNHNNVVRLYEHNETDESYNMYMEYCDKGGALAEKVLEKHTPVGANQKLISYAEDILQGLHYIHGEGVIHADMKLENILKQSPDVVEEYPMMKICDFGLSNKMDGNGQLSMPKVGTMGYMAPEIGKGCLVDSSIDMWSFGVLLYELSAAYKPTAVKNYKYGSGPIPFRNVDWRKRDKSLQDLIEQCLKIDPKERITVSDALNHPWFSEETD